MLVSLLDKNWEDIQMPMPVHKISQPCVWVGGWGGGGGDDFQYWSIRSLLPAGVGNHVSQVGFLLQDLN
jgi:hypothetical protein